MRRWQRAGYIQLLSPAWSGCLEQARPPSPDPWRQSSVPTQSGRMATTRGSRRSAHPHRTVWNSSSVPPHLVEAYLEGLELKGQLHCRPAQAAGHVAQLALPGEALPLARLAGGLPGELRPEVLQQPRDLLIVWVDYCKGCPGESEWRWRRHVYAPRSAWRSMYGMHGMRGVELRSYPRQSTHPGCSPR